MQMIYQTVLKVKQCLESIQIRSIHEHEIFRRVDPLIPYLHVDHVPHKSIDPLSTDNLPLNEP